MLVESCGRVAVLEQVLFEQGYFTVIKDRLIAAVVRFLS